MKAIFIAGWARSSSTLLDVMLGQADGFLSTGELRYLWRWGIGKGWLCGCGETLPRCSTWSAILADALGPGPGEHERVARRMAALQLSHVRLRHLPAIAARSSAPEPSDPLGDYVATLDRLYRSIARVTGARVVIDSSKMPQDAAVLRLVPSVDPYLVHLVRDPRAVAHSMQRRTMLQDSGSDPVEMPTSSAAASTLGWLRANAAAELMRARFGPRRALLIRYEDLVAAPRVTLERIAGMVGEPLRGVSFLDERTIDMAPNHTVWGNPSRFRTGHVRIRHDSEWTTRLPRRDRRVSTGLALPLLPRYRYPVNPEAAPVLEEATP